MIEKNVRKLKAKRNRVWFDMRLGTIEHQSAKHPTRKRLKEELRRTGL